MKIRQLLGLCILLVGTPLIGALTEDEKIYELLIRELITTQDQGKVAMIILGYETNDCPSTELQQSIVDLQLTVICNGSSANFDIHLLIGTIYYDSTTEAIVSASREGREWICGVQKNASGWTVISKLPFYSPIFIE